MKTSIKLFIFSCIIFFAACERNNQSYTNFRGKWIESVQRKDTLLFFNSDSIDFFILSNGLELRNGYILPKAGSGPYGYKFRNDSILIHDGFSNTMIYKPYYYELNSTCNVLRIGNFYNSNLPASKIMTFVRIN